MIEKNNTLIEVVYIYIYISNLMILISLKILIWKKKSISLKIYCILIF